MHKWTLKKISLKYTLILKWLSFASSDCSIKKLRSRNKNTNLTKKDFMHDDKYTRTLILKLLCYGYTI